jgi:putative FmdB family regulatory protein
MPTYEYVCANGHAFERIQKMNDKPVAKCPECGAKASRKISGGQGLIFKGSGFYITDYGKDGKGPRKGGEGAASMPEPSSSKGESKSESKAESKTDSTPKADTAPKPEKKSKSGSADSA